MAVDAACSAGSMPRMPNPAGSLSEKQAFRPPKRCGPEPCTTAHEPRLCGDHANVIVERTFDEPVALEEVQAIEDAGAWCLETHNVEFVRTFFSTDRKRMVCAYRAPDAESVRLAQREAKMPFTDVWSFQRLRPSDLS